MKWNFFSLPSAVVTVKMCGVWPGLTVDGSQDDTGVVVGDDVGVTIFGLVYLQIGVFPGELLAGINRLKETETDRTRTNEGEIRRAGGGAQQLYSLNIRKNRRRGVWGWGGANLTMVKK